jgi:hypothetical protein
MDALYNTLFRRGLPLAVTSFWTGQFAKEHRTHTVNPVLKSAHFLVTLPRASSHDTCSSRVTRYGMPAALFPRGRRCWSERTAFYYEYVYRISGYSYAIRQDTYPAYDTRVYTAVDLCTKFSTYIPRASIEKPSPQSTAHARMSRSLPGPASGEPSWRHRRAVRLRSARVRNVFETCLNALDPTA